MKKILLEVEVIDDEVRILNQQLEITEGKMSAVEGETQGVTKEMLSMARAARSAAASLRLAFIATGIGAFIVAMGLLVVFWKDIKDFITGATKSLEKQKEVLETQNKFLKVSLERNKLIEKSLKAQGKSTDDILIARDKILKAEQLLIISQLENLRGLRAILLAKAQELSLAQKIAEQDLRRQGIDIGETKGTISEEDRKALDEFNLEIEKLKNNLINLGIIRGAIARGEEPEETPDGDINIRDQVERLGLGSQGKDDRIEKLRTELEELVNLDMEMLEIDFNNKLALDARNEQRAKEAADKQKEIAQLEADAKVQSLMMYAGALSNIGALLGEATAQGKAAAIAAATINAFVGISNVWAEKAEGGFVIAGLATRIAASAIVASIAFANVKKIMAVQVPGGGASRGTFALGGIGGGGAIPQPEFNVVGDTGINQLNDSITGGFDRPTRSFVVFGDIKKAEQIENESIRESTV